MTGQTMYEHSSIFRLRSVFILLALFVFNISLAQTQTCFEYRAGSHKGETAEEACKKYFNAFNIASLAYSHVDGNKCMSVGGTHYYYAKSAIPCPEPTPEEKKCKAKKDTNYNQTGNIKQEIPEADYEKEAEKFNQYGSAMTYSCSDGCTVRFHRSYQYCGGIPDKCYIVGKHARYTGSSCTLGDSNQGGSTGGTEGGTPTTPTDPNTPTTPDGVVPGFAKEPEKQEDGSSKCPSGRCPGNVNGTTVCVPCDKVTTSETIKENSSKNGKDGGTGTGTGTGTGSGDGTGTGDGKGKGDGPITTTIGVECDNTKGKCKTTTTTKKKNADGTTTTNTKTREESKDSYCAKNPHDTKQCGNKKEEDKCEDSSLISCLKIGNPAGEKGNTSELQKTDTVTLNTVPFNTGSGCPAPKTFSVMGTSYNLEFKPLCDLAVYIKPLILLAASIASMQIIRTSLKR